MTYRKSNTQRLLGLAALGLSLTPLALAAAPKVAMPTGDANTVAIIDTGSDQVIDEIRGVDNVHGMAGGGSAGTVLAGSLNPHPADEAPEKPAGVSDTEHSAHHGGSADAQSSRATTGIVYQIDVDRRQVDKQIPVAGFVHHTLVTPDGRYGIATHPASGGVSVIDMQAGELKKYIATGPAPNYAVADAAGSRIWVSNSANNTISEIDTGNWIVRRNLLVGEAPEHIVLSPDGASLYVVESGAGTVAKLALASGEVVERYEIGNSPHGIDVSADGTRLYASAKDDDTLVAVDLRSGERRTLGLSPAPYHLTAVDGTDKLYVSSRERSIVWVVSQRDMQVLGDIPIRGIGHQAVVLEDR